MRTMYCGIHAAPWLLHVVLNYLQFNKFTAPMQTGCVHPHKNSPLLEANKDFRELTFPFPPFL